jgi:hypothetical protein
MQFYVLLKSLSNIEGGKGKWKFSTSLMEFPISRILFARQMALSSTSCASNYQNVILHTERDYKLTHAMW